MDSRMIEVPEELVRYAAEVLIEKGCPEDHYEPGCAGCKMTTKGMRLKGLVDPDQVRTGADHG